MDDVHDAPAGTPSMHHPVLSTVMPALSARSMNRAAYSFVVNLIIPGTPYLNLVFTFINEHHPSILGDTAPKPNSAHDWQPFDFALHR